MRLSSKMMVSFGDILYHIPVSLSHFLYVCDFLAFEASIVEVEKSGLELFLYKLMKYMNSYIM